jgi:hypothetical protein
VPIKRESFSGVILLTADMVKRPLVKGTRCFGMPPRGEIAFPHGRIKMPVRKSSQGAGHQRISLARRSSSLHLRPNSLRFSISLSSSAASARELLSRFRHQRKMRENKVGRGVSLGVSMYAGTGCGEAAGGRVNSSGMKSQSGDMGVLVIEWDAMLRLSPHGEIALPHAPIRGRSGGGVKT